MAKENIYVCQSCGNTEGVLKMGYCPKCGPVQVMSEDDYEAKKLIDSALEEQSISGSDVGSVEEVLGSPTTKTTSASADGEVA